MNSNKVITSVVFAASALAVALPFAASALEMRSGERSSVEADERIIQNVYLAGGTVTDTGTITRDLTAAGGTLLITGPVGTDVLAAGGNVTITGDVGDDVRAVGGSVLIQGKVGGDVAVAGGQLVVGGIGIGGDVLAAGGEVSIDTPVAGSMRIFARNVRINAPVQGNVEIQAEKVTLGPRAVINGNLTYSAEAEAIVESGALVKGETHFDKRVASTSKDVGAAVAGFITLWLIARLLMLLAGAFALLLIFPRYARELAVGAAQSPWPSLGAGIVFLIVMPVVSVVLLASVVGIPLGIIGLAAYVAALAFGSFAAALLTGALLFHWIFKKGYVVSWQSALLGVLVYFVLGFIPFLGWIAKCVLFALVLGAMVRIKRDIISRWR